MLMLVCVRVGTFELTMNAFSRPLYHMPTYLPERMEAL